MSIPKKVINLFISYTLDTWLTYLNTHFALDNCLFGPAKLTMNTDLYKYKHSSYNIEFDSLIIFAADMSPSVHVDDKKI